MSIINGRTSRPCSTSGPVKDEVERPAPASLVRLAGALNLSVARLFTLAGHPYPNLDDLLKTDYGLSEEDIAEVTPMVDRLASEGRS